MRAKPRHRAIDIPEPELIARISAWRDAYQCDPRVTLLMIAKDVGVSLGTVSTRIKNLEWTPSAAVERARKGHKHDGFREFPRPTGPAEAEDGVLPMAAPSVWHLASGRSVTTVRRGGRHVEVDA